MEDQKKEKGFFDKLDEKFRAMPLWKKILAISLYVIIFISIGWQIYDMQDVVSTTIITVSYNYHQSECEIVFREGIKINSTCPSHIENWALGYDQDMYDVDGSSMNLTFQGTNITI